MPAIQKKIIKLLKELQLTQGTGTFLTSEKLWKYRYFPCSDRQLARNHSIRRFFTEKFYRFSDYLFKSPQMSERLVISSISGILRFGRYPAYHGISEPHLALKSSKTVVETAAYYYAASLSIAAFAEA